MSHYPDNYQWDYNGGPPNRRAHYPFSGPPPGWAPMGMPNPYYHNPHMMPAHAHANNRLNHWVPPTKLQRAHSYSSHHSGHGGAKTSKATEPLSNPRGDTKAVLGLERGDETVDLSSRLGNIPATVTEKPVALTVDKASDKEISSTNETVSTSASCSSTLPLTLRDSNLETATSNKCSNRVASDSSHSLTKQDSATFLRVPPVHPPAAIEGLEISLVPRVPPVLDNIDSSSCPQVSPLGLEKLPAVSQDLSAQSSGNKLSQSGENVHLTKPEAFLLAREVPTAPKSDSPPPTASHTDSAHPCVDAKITNSSPSKTSHIPCTLLPSANPTSESSSEYNASSSVISSVPSSPVQVASSPTPAISSPTPLLPSAIPVKSPPHCTPSAASSPTPIPPSSPTSDGITGSYSPSNLQPPSSLDPVASSTPLPAVRPGKNESPLHQPIDVSDSCKGDEPVVSQSVNTVEFNCESVAVEEKGSAAPVAEVVDCLPTVSSTSTDVKPSVSGTSKKKKPPKRKGKALKGKEQGATKKPKVVKMISKEKNEWKGPVLHVTGSRDSPLTVDILNAPRNDDEEERKDKRPVPPRAHHHFDLRGHSRSGLFSSTLSSRYDAKTSDPTWVCVFCKCGPHRMGLGDLFGPYTVSRDKPNDSCELGEFSGDEQDIVDAQKRGGRNKKSIRANNLVEHFTKMSRKLKRNQTCEATAAMLGLTAVDPDPDSSGEGAAQRYTVWTHEMCAVWSPGICLVDTRLLGLQEAVWHCQQEKCSKCGKLGANLGCIHRNCPNRSHYACAVEAGWHLPIETFISTCHFHVQRS